MLSARQRSYPLAAHWRDHAGSYAFDLHSGGLRESQNVFMGGNHGRNQVASAQLISRELGRKRKSVAEGILRPRLAVFRRPRCEAGLHPRPSRSGWFGLQTRGLRVDMEASAASICRGRAASLRSAGQPRRLSLREPYTRSSSFSCCAAPPFHDASNCFWINPAS